MGRRAPDDLTAELALVPAAARYTDPGLDFDEVTTGARLVDRIVVDVWVYAPDHGSVLLVRHPRRGWVMPGGKVEAGESFRSAAVRELAEETGIRLDARTLVPAGAYLGADPDSPGVDLGIAFAAVVDPEVALVPEPDRPAVWWSLEVPWPSIYPHDRARLRAHVDTTRPRGHAERR